MNKDKIEKMKKKVDERTVTSILNVCKLYKIDYANLPTLMKKAIIGIYQRGIIDVLKEIKR